MWVVVQEQNHHQLEQFVALAADLGFPQVVFSLQLNEWGSKDLAQKNHEIRVDDQLSRDRLLALVPQGESLGVKVAFWWVNQKYSSASPDRLCPWPFNRAFIGSDSRTVPCCMIGTPDVYQIGTSKRFSEVWLSDEYRDFRRAHIEGNPPAACKACYESNS